MESIIKSDGVFLSNDKKHDIYYFIVAPKEKPKAILQFCHGLAEHGERYVSFGEYLANNGIAFCMHDSLGHKRSVVNDTELGYYGEKDGWQFLYEDALTLTDILTTKYPNTPFFIGGHSMGSFVARAYAINAKIKLDGAIFIGTGHATAVIKTGTTVARCIGLIKGKTYHSKLLDSLSFGAYNKKIPSPKTSFDWLSANEKNVSNYVGDKYCGFISTCQGFVDVSLLIRYISKKSNVKKVDINTPLLFLSGKLDPVGNYGKLVTKAAELHKKVGAKDVTVELIDDLRHEVLQETQKDKVLKLILDWLIIKAKI